MIRVGYLSVASSFVLNAIPHSKRVKLKIVVNKTDSQFLLHLRHNSIPAAVLALVSMSLSLYLLCNCLLKTSNCLIKIFEFVYAVTDN